MNPTDCEPEGPEGCVEECGVPLELTKQMLGGGMSFGAGSHKQRISLD